MSESVGVPPSPGRRWCPAVSPAPCAWSSPAAAASFPGTEPSSLPPLLFSDLGGGVEKQQTAVTYSQSSKEGSPLIFSTRLICFILFDRRARVFMGSRARHHRNYHKINYRMKFRSKNIVKKNKHMYAIYVCTSQADDDRRYMTVRSMDVTIIDKPGGLRLVYLDRFH